MFLNLSGVFRALQSIDLVLTRMLEHFLRRCHVPLSNLHEKLSSKQLSRWCESPSHAQENILTHETRMICHGAETWPLPQNMAGKAGALLKDTWAN